MFYQFRYTNNNAAVCWLIITADAPFTQLSTNGQAYLDMIKWVCHPFPWLCSLLFKQLFSWGKRGQRAKTHTAEFKQVYWKLILTMHVNFLLTKKTSKSHLLFVLLNDMSWQASFFMEFVWFLIFKVASCDTQAPVYLMMCTIRFS